MGYAKLGTISKHKKTSNSKLSVCSSTLWKYELKGGKLQKVRSPNVSVGATGAICANVDLQVLHRRAHLCRVAAGSRFTYTHANLLL